MIYEARFGHEVRGGLRAGDSRPQHSLELLAGMALECLDAVLVESPLFFLGQGVQVLRVVDSVAHEVPISLHHGRLHFRVVLQYGQVEGHGAADVVLVQDLEHSPESHPVAVVTVGVVSNVGVGHAGPRVPLAVEVGQILVVLYVGGYPEGHPCPAGPSNRRTVDDGAVLDAVGWQTHGRASPRALRSSDVSGSIISLGARLRHKPSNKARAELFFVLAKGP